MNNVFTFGSEVIDFTTAFPRLNGEYVLRKQDWLNLIRIALRSVNYKFDLLSHPVPAIITNWSYIDKKTCRKWMIQVFRDITNFPPELIRLMRLDIGGFHIQLKNETKLHRPCRLEMRADGFRESAFCFLEDASNIVERFLNTNHTNKIIVVN